MLGRALDWTAHANCCKACCSWTGINFFLTNGSADAKLQYGLNFISILDFFISFYLQRRYLAVEAALSEGASTLECERDRDGMDGTHVAGGHGLLV